MAIFGALSLHPKSPFPAAKPWRDFSRPCASKFDHSVIRDLWAGPVLRLFRIESERLKLPAPFCRQSAKPLDADAARQATFYGGFDKIGCEEGE